MCTVSELMQTPLAVFTELPCVYEDHGTSAASRVISCTESINVKCLRAIFYHSSVNIQIEISAHLSAKAPLLFVETPTSSMDLHDVVIECRLMLLDVPRYRD